MRLRTSNPPVAGSNPAGCASIIGSFEGRALERDSLNSPVFRWRPTGDWRSFWYGLEPVPDAPDAVDVGVVRRRLHTGPDAADVYIHRAAGYALPARP